MLILISWLHEKPADLDLHSFQNKGIDIFFKGNVCNAIIHMLLYKFKGIKTGCSALMWDIIL